MNDEYFKTVTILQIDAKLADGYIQTIKLLREASIQYISNAGDFITTVTYSLQEAKKCIDDISSGRPRMVDIKHESIQKLKDSGFIIEEEKKIVYDMTITRRLVQLVREL